MTESLAAFLDGAKSFKSTCYFDNPNRKFS